MIKNGNEYEQTVDVSKVNPNSCSYTEMLALNANTGNRLIGYIQPWGRLFFNHDLTLQKVRISLIHFPYRRYPSQFPSVFMLFISSCAIAILI